MKGLTEHCELCVFFAFVRAEDGTFSRKNGMCMWDPRDTPKVPTAWCGQFKSPEEYKKSKEHIEVKFDTDGWYGVLGHSEETE